MVCVGETVTEPAPVLSRVTKMLPGWMTALTALVEATVSVEDCPAAIVVGSAVSVAVVTRTVTVAVSVATAPSAAVTVRV